MSILSKITGAATLLLVISTVVFYTMWEKQRNKANRWEENYQQELLENSLIRYTAKELKENQDSTIIALRDSLDLRPKEVVRYRVIHQSYTDTVEKRRHIDVDYIVPVSLQTSLLDDVFIAPFGKYPFTFKENCYSIIGHVELGKEMDVVLDNVTFESQFSDVIYKKRKHKFLFIHFGRWEYYRDVIGDCGDFTSREVEVIKE